jgi:uncharacterized protein
MPVHKAGGGYQWGGHGKVYKGRGAKAKAAKQGRAAYANGYKGRAIARKLYGGK